MMKTYDYRLFMFIFAKIRSKTDKTMKRTLLSIASLALIFSVNSCSDFKFEFNEDYDLNNIKIDKFSGLQGIAAPIGSTTKFMIGDYLDLEATDGVIKVDEDGYYYISMSDSELLNEEFKIDRFSLNGDGLEISQSFSLFSHVAIPESNFPIEVLPNNSSSIGENLQSNTDILDDVLINENIPDIGDYLIDKDVDFSLKYPIDIQENNIPEMFCGDDVVCDFADIRLKIFMKNGLPFSGSIDTTIDKYIAGSDSPLPTYALPFNFVAETDVEQTYSEENVEGFNSILNPIPDYLRFNVAMNVNTENLIINTDYPYSVQCGYEFLAPLAFGDDFRLRFTQDFTGLGVKEEVMPEGLELLAADLKFNLINTLPFNFELSAVAIDAEGNELTHLTVELEGEIKGGSVDSPAVNPMALNVTNYGPLEFDGIKLTFSATSATDYAALNKNQYIQLTDISLTLPQGVSYTLNEEN